MEVEDIAGVRLAPGRTAQEEGDLAVGPGVLAEVVVDDEGVAAALHDLLADGATGVGGEVLEGGGLGGVRRHDDRVLHGAVLFELAEHLGDLAGLLADGDVDADQVAAILVDDGVEGDRALAGRAVADDELALAATDGNHRVDRLDAGLHGRIDTLAEGDAGSDALDRARLRCADGALAIDGVAEGADDAADELVAHGHLDDAAGGAHLVAFLDVLVVAEDDGADGLLLEVEGEAHRAVGELEQLGVLCVAEAVGAGHAVAGFDDDADVGRDRWSLELLDLLAEDGCDLFGANGHAASFLSVAAARRRAVRGAAASGDCARCHQ